MASFLWIFAGHGAKHSIRGVAAYDAPSTLGTGSNEWMGLDNVP